MAGSVKKDGRKGFTTAAKDDFAKSADYGFEVVEPFGGARK